MQAQRRDSGPCVTLRADHPLVGATIVDLDALLAEASLPLCAVLDRACELAHLRVAAARARARRTGIGRPPG